MQINYYSIFHFVSKNRFIFLFLLSFVLMMSYSLEQSNIVFRGDAYEIWEVAKHFYDHDPYHSFVEYRGPATFIYYNAIYELSQLMHINDVLFFRIYSSLVFSFLTVFIFPYIFSYIVDKKIQTWQVALFSGLIFYFFRGYFLHPQTDIPAFTFFLCTVSALIVSIKSKKSYLYYAIAGILLAISIMMRANYILSIPVFLFFIVNSELTRQTSRLKIFKFLVVFIFFIFTTMSPNYIKEESSSNNLSSSELLWFQLWGGVSIQKVEWNANGPQLTFTDKRGVELLKLHGISTDNNDDSKTNQAYYDLYFNHPFDMLIIQMQHLFNGLDITYNSVYIYDVHKSRILFSFVNYIIVFIALMIISTKYIRVKYVRSLSLLLAMAIPSLASIPFIVEVRFFMSLIMTFIAIVVFDFRYAAQMVVSNKLYVPLALFVILCFLNSANSFNSIEWLIPL